MASWAAAWACGGGLGSESLTKKSSSSSYSPPELEWRSPHSPKLPCWPRFTCTLAEELAGGIGGGETRDMSWPGTLEFVAIKCHTSMALALALLRSISLIASFSTIASSFSFIRLEPCVRLEACARVRVRATRAWVRVLVSSRFSSPPVFTTLLAAPDVGLDFVCCSAPGAAPARRQPRQAPRQPPPKRRVRYASCSPSHERPRRPAHLAAILQRSCRVRLIRLRKLIPPSHAAPRACLHALGSVPTAASSWRTRVPPPSHAKP